MPCAATPCHSPLLPSIKPPPPVQIVSAYFLTLYALAKRVPPDAPSTPSFDERAEAAPAPAAGGWDGSLQGAAAGQPAAAQQQQQQQGHGTEEEDSRTITVLHGATALALAAAICFAGTQIAQALRYKGGSITVITGITGEQGLVAKAHVMLGACNVRICAWAGATLYVPPWPVPNAKLSASPLPSAAPVPLLACSQPLLAVTLATLFPRLLAPLRASGEGLAAILMQVSWVNWLAIRASRQHLSCRLPPMHGLHLPLPTTHTLMPHLIPCFPRPQLFFASVGASGSIATVMRTAPALFLWSAIAVSSKKAPAVAGLPREQVDSA